MCLTNNVDCSVIANLAMVMLCKSPLKSSQEAGAKISYSLESA